MSTLKNSKNSETSTKDSMKSRGSDESKAETENIKSNGATELSGPKSNKDSKGTPNKKEGSNKDGIRENAYIQKNDGKKRGPAGPSILKRANIKSDKNREDSKGNPILRGGKKHKIIFTEPLEKVNIVDNWKDHNAESHQSGPCNCNIF